MKRLRRVLPSPLVIVLGAVLTWQIIQTVSPRTLAGMCNIEVAQKYKWLMEPLRKKIFCSDAIEATDHQVAASEVPASPEQASDPVSLFAFPDEPDLREAMSEIADRPLFAETRRRPEPIEEPEIAPEPVAFVEVTPEPKFAPEPVIEETPEPDFPGLEFRGIVRDGKDDRILVFHPPSATDVWLKVGDEIDGWVLLAISDETLSFSRDDFQRTVRTWK